MKHFEIALSDTVSSIIKKTNHLKTLKIVLLLLVATVLTGCGTDLIESPQVKQDVLKLCRVTDKGYSTRDVKVLNWDYNSDLIGDSYIGYIITYEIGSGYYALISLIEFDNSPNSKYEIELIYRGRSLKDLNEYVYSIF